MSNDTNAIINSLKKAVKKSDNVLFSELIPSLIKNEPNYWLTLLHINGIIPDPNSDNFAHEIQLLFDCIDYAVKQGKFTAKERMELFYSLTSFHFCFSSINRRIKELSVWEKPAISTIYRLASYLEDQSYLIIHKVDELVKKNGYFEPSMLIREDIPSSFLGEIGLPPIFRTLG
jgi:hypothetical protein